MLEGTTNPDIKRAMARAHQERSLAFRSLFSFLRPTGLRWGAASRWA